MDLPSPRELELETLLRQRDAQVSELGDEVTRLRQYVSAQPPPSTTEPVSLPPALTALLLPHLDSTAKSSVSTSSTAALTQRTRLLQEENDELYQLLKQGETGKLKEEVHGLRKVVKRLEDALKDSHSIVKSLSNELDKSYAAILTIAPRAEKSHSHSPRNSYHGSLPPGNGAASSNLKLPPTGPRAHKKPRLSEANRASPPAPGPGPSSSKGHTRNSRSTSSRPDARTGSEQSPRQDRGKANNHAARMEVDEPKQSRPRSPAERDKDKDLRHRDRERREERERDKERDRGERDGRPERDGGRRDRRNGNFGGGGGGGRSGRRADRGPPNNAYQGGDRTLKERLGL
ncbi:hypothetical protein DFH06DRAFT_1161765 [Mycena polygramma]|nr:hypothetical protein DFH06DRAFT_1161765 [Mycena polygramma]